MRDTSLVSSESKKHEWRYVPVEGHWDEAVTAAGFPRRHWRKVSVAIGRRGFQELTRSWQAGRQIIQSQGITCNAGEEPGDERPWPADPIPLVIDSREWVRIERAIIQRATLLNLMLQDFYGGQRLLRDRLIPPALVYGNPHFLRPCHGVAPPGGVYLHTFAADLARSPDGCWWVISDRTQAPSGMGYALENRILSARTLPNLFSQCEVRQVRRFFDARRDSLQSLAIHRQGPPRIVLLTPGPYNETYFEHSFLAGHWGFPLVEGADLIVRDNRVYLKTLAGLDPVDVIVRRLDDNFCDPIELRGDSLLGVPGLLQAVRSGAVAVVNALGSGLVETPAHMAFLPGLCRHLLSEELRIPSVATWWCGQEGPRRYVLDHLQDLIIKPAFPRFRRQAEFPLTLGDVGREELARRIEARPGNFVAQELVALSTAPVHTDSGLSARHVVLRVFASWDGSSYSVMPGGLTRVSTEGNSLAVSMQSGGGSKDTWVLGGAGAYAAGPPRQPLQIDSEANKGNLPSRVADNLYWLGRYAERVEARVRLVRALLPALSGEEDFGRPASLVGAIHLLTGLRRLPPEDAPRSPDGQLRLGQRLLADMIDDPSQSSGLRWNLRQMRRAARQLKERLSADTWRVLQQLDLEFVTSPADREQRSLVQMNLLDGAIVTLSAFAGLLMENTTRGFGWRFLEMGRRIERALQTAELLTAGLTGAREDLEPSLQLLLQIADSSITYRSRYLTVLRADLTLQLLLADETNPRSIGFQLASLLHQVERLQENDGGKDRRIHRPLALKLLNAVRSADVSALAERDASGRFAALEILTRQLAGDLFDLSDALTADYLSHLTPSRLTSSL